MTFARRKFVLVCFAATCFAAPAWAEGEVPPVVAAILKNWEQQMKLKPTYESIETDADGNVTISNMAVELPAQAGGPAVKVSVAEVYLEDVSDEGEGLYEIGDATFTDFKMDIAGPDGMAFTVAMPEGSAEDWYVKDVGASPTPLDTLRSSMNVARRMSSGKIVVSAMGQTVTSDGYETLWDGDPATGAGTFTTKLSNVVIPESVLAMADPTGTLKSLGYSGLVFDIAGDGKMDLDGDNLGFDFNFAYIGKDMGSLKMGFSAADIPLAVFGSLQQAQLSGQPPDINALMPQLQAISLSGVSIRFEDASITKKLLPILAAMQGMDEAAMVANAGAMAQMGLMQLNNQAFSEQVVGAINAFLKEPKSLTVALKPAAPVKVMDLMSLNPADPGAAIGKLGVTISAND